LKDQRKIDVKARGFKVNPKQTRTNEQQEDKECETRRLVVENTTTKCKGGALSAFYK
jgi:hypothetical protein